MEACDAVCGGTEAGAASSLPDPEDTALSTVSAQHTMYLIVLVPNLLIAGYSLPFNII
jgi:hypothetical protein